MPQPVVGDPLTGSLPRTQLVVPQQVLGPTRARRPREAEWPLVADPQAITIDQLKPGRVAYVRTRRGVRRYLIRTVSRSYERGRNRGQTYVTGMSTNGWCRAFWANRIVSTQSQQQALSAGRLLTAIGPASSR